MSGIPPASQCESRDGANCKIAAEIVGLAAVETCTDEACAVCQSREKPPKDVNQVTLSLAISACWDTTCDEEALEKAKARHRNLDRVTKIVAAHGPGSQLWKLLEEDFGIEHKPNCPCLKTAEDMNRLGAVGCKRERARIVSVLKDGQALYSWREVIAAGLKATTTGGLTYVNILDPLGSLCDEAIRRAEAYGIDSAPPAPGINDP